MAKQQPHQVHIDMMNAFESADRNTPKNTALGGERYGMGAAGMPRTAAQQSSVKKAALSSALKRGERAKSKQPTPVMPSPMAPKPGVATGSMSITKKPPKGLLL